MSWVCVNRECIGQNKMTVTADHFSQALHSVGGEDEFRKTCVDCKVLARCCKKNELVERLMKGEKVSCSIVDSVLKLEDSAEELDDDEIEICLTDSESREVSFDKKLEKVIDATLGESDFQIQLDAIIEDVSKRFNSLQDEFDETEQMFCSLEEDVDRMRRDLLLMDESVTKREIPPVEILEKDDKAINDVDIPTPLHALVEDQGVWVDSIVKSVRGGNYTVFLPDGSTKTVGGRQVAFKTSNKRKLAVGTRVVVKCREQELYRSAVVAEPPKVMNKNRYLVFYDDTNAAYVDHQQLRIVVERSPNVWDDVPMSGRMFIYKYMKMYPERAMVKLAVGQNVKAEYEGKWCVCKVEELDASLVLLRFVTEQRTEWMYRGSHRLGPIFIEMEKKKKADEKDKISVKAEVAKVAVARKSGVISSRRVISSKKVGTEREAEGSVHNVARLVKKRLVLTPHSCSNECVAGYQHRAGGNHLLVPLLQGWDRQVARYKGSRRIFYLAPCGRRLSSLGQVHRYLEMTRLELEIDCFCYDWWVHVELEFQPSNVLTFIKDISYGVEAVPVTCANSVDTSYPEYIEYSTVRMPQSGVKINVDEEFLTGCDCEDNCVDKEKCSCWQLTIQNTKCDRKNMVDPDVGYEYKRLHDMVMTGIYECNTLCKCRKTCFNRVVQNPLKQKLQVFKTDKRGWGIRTLTDIPGGTYILSYVGNLYNSVEGNKLGKDFGDEYFADLDMIEVVESRKDGYESDISSGEVKSSPSEYCPSDVTDGSDAGENVLGGVKKKRSKKGCITPVKKVECSGKADIPSTRKFFGAQEESYIMDAKIKGNIGRFFNHSCHPNVFVQNVFVDTHDLRFPWISFFTSTYVRAGQELCWDYGYEVGSIPGKEIYCCCGAHNCRGRLL